MRLSLPLDNAFWKVNGNIHSSSMLSVSVLCSNYCKVLTSIFSYSSLPNRLDGHSPWSADDHGRFLAVLHLCVSFNLFFRRARLRHTKSLLFSPPNCLPAHSSVHLTAPNAKWSQFFQRECHFGRWCHLCHSRWSGGIITTKDLIRQSVCIDTWQVDLLQMNFAHTQARQKCHKFSNTASLLLLLLLLNTV